MTLSRKDLSSKFTGIPTSELSARAKDNRKYSPKERAEIKKEIEMRAQVREETGGAAIAGSPGNNTRSGPGMGDDSTLHARKMKKARDWKNIWKKHGTSRKASVVESSSLYYLQPNGMWKKGGDGRSAGMTREQLLRAGKKNKIEENKKQSLVHKLLK